MAVAVTFPSCQAHEKTGHDNSFQVMLVWILLVRNPNYGKVTMSESNGIRICSDCAFDMDAESAIPCQEHTWHYDDTWDDMCCKCGLDAEMLLK